MCYQRYLIVLIQSCFLFKPLGRWVRYGCFAVSGSPGATLNHWVQPGDRHLFWMHLIAETLMFGLGLFL